MQAFEFSPRTRIVFGQDSVDRLGSLAAELGAERAFLVTDPGIVASGHVDRAERALAASSIEVLRFDAVHENPSSVDVSQCHRALGEFAADLIIGLGGGSSIDVAKGCNFIRAGGGRMEDYWGVGKARGDLLPMIAIPTTAGTGSEVQSFALIEKEGSHQKMACGDPQAAPKIAILDPTLTVTQPRFVTACTGMDTIAHALETAVTKRRTPVSHMLSTEAFVLARTALPSVLADPDDLEARGKMLLAAALAGLAIENSMLGAAHSMANPLTAHHGIVHGQAVGLVLPHVLRFNAADEDARTLYAELARGADLSPRGSTTDQRVAALIMDLGDLLQVAGFGSSLAGYDLSLADLDALAAEAAEQWTAQFNPRQVGPSEFRQLFADACASS